MSFQTFEWSVNGVQSLPHLPGIAIFNPDFQPRSLSATTTRFIWSPSPTPHPQYIPRSAGDALQFAEDPGYVDADYIY